MSKIVGVGILLIASLILTDSSPAQSETFYVVQWSRYMTSEVYRVGRDGSIQQTMARLNMNQIPVSLVQDEQNSGFYILGNWYGTKPYGFVEHVTRAGVHTTVHATTPWSRFPVHMLRDGDGRWLVLDNDLNLPQGIVTYDFRGKTMASLSRAVNLWAWAAAIHPETGHILVRGQTKSSPMDFGYFSIDPATGQWTKVATSSTLIYTILGAREPIYDAALDCFWDDPYDLAGNGTKVLRVNRTFGLSTFRYYPGIVPTSLEPAGGRSVARPFRALLATALTGSPSFSLYDMDRTGAVTTVGTLPGTGTLWARSDLTRRDSRHLTWVMNRAPHDRSLRLSFPGEAGRPYVVGLTLSGAHPGIPLPDGRTIPLNFDGLTAVSVTGSLPSILTGTVGVLDATGTATARIDVASVAAVLKGLRVVAAVIVTDPSAPSGLAHVTGATGFTIR